MSCATQKSLAAGHIMSFQIHPSPFCIAADDGVSGTTFQRKGIQQMQKMAEEGLIDTIIVKDYCAIIGLNQKGLETQGILA